MSRPKLRLTVRGFLCVVGLIAVALGLIREITRIQHFQTSALYYLGEEERQRDQSQALRRLSRAREADECAHRAEFARSMARWHFSHILTGGTPPADPRLEGWSIEEAYKRAGVVLAGKVINFGWSGTNVSIKVSRVFKGTPKNPATVSVSTRYIAAQAAHLRQGENYLVFYVEDDEHHNPAMRLFDQTGENLYTLKALCCTP